MGKQGIGRVVESRQGIDRARHGVSTAISAVAVVSALFGLSASAALAAAPLPEDPSFGHRSKAKVVPGHYIVALKDSVANPEKLAENQVEQQDGKLGVVYSSALKGYAAKLSKDAVEELRKDPRVRYVVPDYELKAQAQTIPDRDRTHPGDQKRDRRHRRHRRPAGQRQRGRDRHRRRRQTSRPERSLESRLHLRNQWRALLPDRRERRLQRQHLGRRHRTASSRGVQLQRRIRRPDRQIWHRTREIHQAV